jgi:actin-like ATPase involved in cell morphogenesis
VNQREAYLRALYALSKNVPPEVWDKFKESLIVYVSDQIEKVIGSAPSQDIQIAVGYVRYMREFRDEVKNIDTLIQKMDREKQRSTT